MEKLVISENNIKIYSYSVKQLHSFCISLYVKAGPLYENEQTNGISHCFEHIVFRNINFLLGGLLYKELDRYGLEFSAYTYNELVQFKMWGATKNFKKACDIITLALESISLPKKELSSEIGRIKAEMRENSEKTTLDYFSQGHVWEGTPLTKSICGSVHVLNKITCKKLEEYRKEILSANNIFFYVTGAYSEEDIDYLKKCTEKRPVKITVPDKNNCAGKPKNFKKRSCLIKLKNSPYTMVRFSFDADKEKVPYETLRLMYEMLFQGDSSKMFTELSEKSSLVYSYDARIDEYKDVANIYFSFEVKPSRLYEAVEKVILVLKQFKEGITDELLYVRAQFTDNAYTILDDIESLNWSRSYEGHILENGVLSIEEKKEMYLSVTNEDIKRGANEVFTTENLVFCAKCEKKKVSEEKLSELLMKL